MDMDMSGSDDDGPLSPAGLNMTNSTVMSDFLDEVLADDDFMPINTAMARTFWYGMVIVIAVAAMTNLIYQIKTRARLRAAAGGKPNPTIPANPFSKCLATITALAREASYPQIVPSKYAPRLSIPPLGTMLLLLTYLGFIMGLEYYHDFVPGAQHYQAFSLRAAWVTLAQLPLLLLLAGKNNLIGLVTGIAYERLNVFHRWVGRAIWLTATLHWAYQQHGWDLYGLTAMEKATDVCYPTGVAAWTILTWMNVSSIAPLRNFSYEFFVIQHIVTFMGFIVAIMIHIPDVSGRVYVYIPIGLFLVDRLLRIVQFAYINSRIGRAEITPFPGDVSKIRIRSCRLRNWKAGQHVFLSLPRFGIIQSHPATILSTPSSHNGDLVFILKAHRGFTARLLKSGGSSTASDANTKLERPKSASSSMSSAEAATPAQRKYIALLSWPYGCSHSDFAAFSSSMLVSCSTGITFTLPILLDIAERAQRTTLPLRHLSFLWVVRSSTWTSWVRDELRSAVEKIAKAGIRCNVDIYVTCDETMTNSSSPGIMTGSRQPGCDCANTDGPCCCTADITPAPSISGKADPEKSVISRYRAVPDFASMQSGRPAVETLIWDFLDLAEGETGIAVCGTPSLNARCRTAVAQISDSRGVHKGSGAQGVYLHVEGFGW